MHNITLLIDIEQYIKYSFLSAARIHEVAPEELSRLPLHIRGAYHWYRGYLQNISVLFAVTGSEYTQPARLQKHQEILRSIFSEPVVFVFERLQAYERMRLIEKQIAFMEPGKQLYVPSLMLELSNISKRGIPPSKVRQVLSPAAQFALLFHLQKTSLAEKTMTDIGNVLNTSAMSVSRIIHEWESMQICKISGKKYKQLLFDHAGPDLWNRIKPLLQSPVKKIWYTDKATATSAFYSNDFALSRYSDLAECKQISYAISPSAFRKMRTNMETHHLHPLDGTYRLEIWAYDPGSLANQKYVDPLSLWLSLQNDEDPRIKDALETMMKRMIW